MKKMDEMDRNIRLHSEELGFKAAVFMLALRVLYECWQGFFNGGIYSRLPALMLIVALCVQVFSEIVMKRKMVAGDEEYKEPNKVLWYIIMSIAVIAIVLSIGFYLMSNNS